MKKQTSSLLAAMLLAFAFTFVPAMCVSCSSAPAQRVTQVTTLKVIGATVDATMTTAVQALKDNRITWAQWHRLAALHDEKFQPAYNLAVAAVQSDLNSLASPDLVGLAAQLSALISSYLPPAR